MKKSNERNELLVPLVIMTTSIIILSVISQYFIDESLSGIKAYVKTITVANQERMLAQDIVKSVATDNLLGQLDGIASLDSLMNDFKHLHALMRTGDTQMNLQPLDERFTAQYKVLDKAHRNFYKEIQLNIGEDSDNNALFFTLLSTQNTYLQELDKLVSAINSYSNSKVSRFQLVEVVAMSGSLLIVALEFIFILLPTFNKIKKQNEQFRQIAYNQSHLVRHPLTTLKELLYLLGTFNNTEEMNELLILAKKEADELDAIINNTVYNAVQSET